MIPQFGQLLQHRVGQRRLTRAQGGERFLGEPEAPRVAGRDEAVDLLLQLGQAQVAAVLDDDLEPAAVPSPHTGGGGNSPTLASGTSCSSTARTRSATAKACRAGSRPVR